MSIMKKIFALLSFVLVLASCSKDFDTTLELAEGEGVVKFGVSLQAKPSENQEVVVKIYKVEAGEESLVRRYTSLNDIPENLVLLYGDYIAKVQVGEKRVASFTEKYFYGEQAFTIDSNSKSAASEVVVECNILSTMVCVEYDSSVFEKLNDGFFTTVAVADSYDADAIANGDVHSLTYTETKNGFFVLPENFTSLIWHFEGNHPVEGKIVKEAVISNVKPAVKYTIRLKYSKDAPGSLVIEAIVDESIEVWDDVIIFSPDPTIVGVGFNINDEQMSVGANHTYQIASMANINTLNLTLNGENYDLLSDTTYEGISVEAVDAMNYRVTISEALFASLTGGKKSVMFQIRDVDGGKLDKEVLYVVQGIAPMTSSDYDIWFGSANVKATICNTASSDVKIAYRANGGEWTSVTAKYTSANLYTATFAIGVESTYEYKLVVDGVDFGSTYSISTPAGVQLPNSDFERWHTSSDIVYPYASGDSPFWLTGNEGSNMAGATLTQASKDVRPGSTGTYSAYLESQFASVFGIGKFAAGNLFTGTFSLSGTNGTVGFGRDFAFTAKPKSITFWMKYNEGTIDQGSQASGADLCSVMVMITDWATPYAVNTADSSTFFTVDDLPTMKGVIGYAAYQSKVSNTEWTEYTLDITYREDMANVRPKKIVVSFTPSGYGDYFCGSTNSWMYVDDIKLNY